EALRDGLARWYRARRRRLPWREEPTAYRVWVSEIMLQQTQVATVIPYFERFIARFPDVHTLAAAPEEAVLAHWAGLGYYRRCRYLHAASKVIVAEHGGVLPDTVAGLLSLPGVGRYTAGAIASIAYGVAAPVLDGNVSRVLSRLLALQEEVDGAAGKRALWAAAETLLDPIDPSSHNQALMELGALVCSPTKPACPTCPLSDHCAAGRSGEAESYPRKRPRKRPSPALAVAGLVVDDAGRVLMARRPSDVLLGGLWELPGGEITADATHRPSVRQWLDERVGVTATVGRHLASVEHVFTHRHLTLDVYRVESHEGEPTPQWYTDARWISPSELDDLPLSRLAEKVLAAVGHGRL
ncbi:MAG: A/G-specific adenine glycosylase, partial [Myxococcota bacterium]|nr:A/G-specific adenine glycosylase [Myxococcota bacterium]